jgi:hypothetical protein
MDLEQLKRSAELARDSHGGLQSGQLSFGAFDSRWDRFRSEWRPETALELLAELGRRQAKIDALMLEYCPGEMTPEQTAAWARHQCRTCKTDAT